MHMPELTRRTQLLLDQERYRALELRAASAQRSVASLIREAIDAALAEGDDATARREAGRRLLAAQMPGTGAEPDWEAVKDDLYEERLRRWYGSEP
jgi:predicted DNA-binding protein